jgi:hypothetical protein
MAQAFSPCLSLVGKLNTRYKRDVPKRVRSSQVPLWLDRLWGIH